MSYPKGLVIVPFFGFLVLLSAQPVVLQSAEASLPGHMIIEHLMFFILGSASVMFAEIILRYMVTMSFRNSHDFNIRSNDKGTLLTHDRNPLVIGIIWKWKYVLRKIFAINRFGYIWLIISISLLALWHIPPIFDFSAQHVQAHIAQHMSFIMVGATAFLAIRSLGESFLLFLLISVVGIMSFIGLLFSILQIPVYNVYSVHDHNDTGMYMIVMSIVMLLIAFPAYVIRRRYIIFESRPKNSPTPYNESSLSYRLPAC